MCRFGLLKRVTDFQSLRVISKREEKDFIKIFSKRRQQNTLNITSSQTKSTIYIYSKNLNEIISCDISPLSILYALKCKNSNHCFLLFLLNTRKITERMLLWVVCVLAGLFLFLLYRSVNKYPGLPGAGIKLPLIGHYQVSSDL